MAKKRGGARRGAVRVRRESAARTVRAEGPQSADVRKRIDDALKAGQQLRRDIERRIEAGLRSGRRRGPSGGRPTRRG